MFEHRGIVDDVFRAATPDTNAAAQKVIVNVERSDLQPQGKAPALAAFQPQVAFFIPAGVTPPARGTAITWGPHHCWWGREPQVPKSYEGQP